MLLLPVTGFRAKNPEIPIAGSIFEIQDLVTGNWQAGN